MPLRAIDASRPPSAALGAGLRRYDGLKRSCPVFAAVPVARRQAAKAVRRTKRRVLLLAAVVTPRAGGAVPLQRPNPQFRRHSTAIAPNHLLEDVAGALGPDERFGLVL